jgi:hypothetical protein
MTSGALHDPQVNQAAGMISVQADCTLAEAIVLLQNRALVSGQSVHEIALETVERRIRFGPSA